MELIQNYQTQFKTHLLKYIQSIYTKQPKELYQPIEYILTASAKHIRPVFCLLSCELYGKTSRSALNAALSIELFHTFSLIHDDILDNSNIRRGKKAIHKKWDTGIAILSGDTLLIESFKLLAKYHPTISNSLLKTMTKASTEICEGQQNDMNFEKLKFISSHQYIEMIRKKTAVLLGTAFQMGTIIANINATEQKKVYTIGENIGIAFQIMDDYLDTFGNTKIFGKKIGNDILANKKTFLLTNALQIANRKQLLKIHQILKMPPSDKKINEMKSLFIDLSIDKLSLNKAAEFNNKNYSIIKSLKAKNEKTRNILLLLSEQLIKRTQ